MNKNGFTLVELLAVIAILALLVVIALPNIMELFSNAKKNSFENELKNIYKAVQNQWMSDSMKTEGLITYSRCSDSSCNNLLKLNGRENLSFYIETNGSGAIVYFIASDGSFQYKYMGNGLNIEDINTSEKITDDIVAIKITGVGVGNIATFVTRQNDEAITPADELKIGNEAFYVVTSDEDKTVLLAKYQLHKTNNKQDTTNTNTNILVKAFANVGYWDGCKYVLNSGCTSSPSGLISPYSDGGRGYGCSSNLSLCNFVYDSNSNLYTYVESYVAYLRDISFARIEGRLLTKKEANDLKNYSTAGLNALKASNNKNYWIGEAASRESISTITTSGGFGSNSSWGAGAGLRPVIVVKTASL